MQVVGAAWCAAMMIVAGVGDLMQMIEDDRTGRVLGGRVIKRSDDAVCGLHRERVNEKYVFLG
jgi:NCAIR mutase (PurE)-related protein